MSGRIRTWLDARPWIWSFGAAFLVWLVTALVPGPAGAGGLRDTSPLASMSWLAYAVAPFLMLVGR